MDGEREERDKERKQQSNRMRRKKERRERKWKKELKEREKRAKERKTRKEAAEKEAKTESPEAEKEERRGRRAGSERRENVGSEEEILKARERGRQKEKGKEREGRKREKRFFVPVASSFFSSLSLFCLFNLFFLLFISPFFSSLALSVFLSLFSSLCPFSSTRSTFFSLRSFLFFVFSPNWSSVMTKQKTYHQRKIFIQAFCPFSIIPDVESETDHRRFLKLLFLLTQLLLNQKPQFQQAPRVHLLRLLHPHPFPHRLCCFLHQG